MFKGIGISFFADWQKMQLDLIEVKVCQQEQTLFFFILSVKIIFNLILSDLRIPKWLNCYILKNAISVKITGTTSIARN
jgi:hypothetical protein